MACTIFEGSGDPDTWIPVTIPAHQPREFRLVVPKYEQPDESLVVDICKRCDKLFATGAIHKLRDGLVFDDELGIVDKDPEKTDGQSVDKDPEKMGGSPCVAGTRVPIRCVLDWLGTGYTTHQVVDQYPSLTAIKIKDALEWTAEAIEGFPDQPPPKPTVGQLEAFWAAHASLRDGVITPDALNDPTVLAWLRHQAEEE